MTSNLFAEVEGAKTLPFYLVFDVSGSMADEIPALNSALLQLKDAITANPLLADIARVSVISFSDDAIIEIPMCDLSADTRITATSQIFSVRGLTSYGQAFATLRTAITEDIAELKCSGNSTVFRPTVFFVTDGGPTDDWTHEFIQLTSIKQYPMLYPFGFRDAPHDVLRQITYPSSRTDGKSPAMFFTVKDGTTPATAINKIVEVVVQSVVSCTTSAAEGAPQHLIDTRGAEDVVVSHEMDAM